MSGRIQYTTTDSVSSSSSEEDNDDTRNNPQLVGAHGVPPLSVNQQYNIEQHPDRLYIVWLVYLVNELLLAIPPLLGIVWSIAYGYDSVLFNKNSTYFSIAICLYALKLAISVFVTYLQFQVVNDPNLKRTKQKWPPPPVYIHEEYLAVLFYTASLIMFGIMLHKNPGITAEIKYYELSGLLFTLPPIMPMASRLAYHVIPKLLRVRTDYDNNDDDDDK